MRCFFYYFFLFASLGTPFFDLLTIAQELDQQAIEEALGIELGKEDEEEDDEQEGIERCSGMAERARSCHDVPFSSTQ